METVYVTYKENGGSGFQILKALDRARTQLYHFNAILIAGMGFFTDAYDLFCISSVTRLLGRLYYYDPTTEKPGSLPPNVSVAVTGVALCGTLAGQLFFGCLGDRMGRKRVYGITLIIMVAMSIASGLSFGKTAKSVMATLCFFRFWLGFGVGGDYPLSAVIMSEYANTATRGAFLAAVFAMQGMGILVAASVSIIVAAAFKNHHPSPSFDENPILSTPDRADYAWRIIFMLGAIPAALTFYWRMRMPETARYTALIEGKLQQASQDMAKVLHVNFDLPAESPLPLLDSNSSNREKFGLFSWEFANRHGRQLVGTACTWFFLDIAYYSGNLFQKDVLSSIGWLPSRNSMSALEELYRVARAQALIALCATVPGYWVTIAVIDRIGRKPIQLIGFFFMTAFMLSISIPYYKLRGEKCPHSTADYCSGHHTTFLILYSFTFFFANFGPNSTTFIVPAELFPARLRSTCHGISAACGKAGAIVGAFGFLYAAQGPGEADRDPGYPPGIGYQKALFILAATNGIGFFFTFLLPETKGKSLEELSGEIPVETQEEHKVEVMAQRKRWRILGAL